MGKCLEAVNHFVWGVPALLLILSVGLYITVRAGFPQFLLFPSAIKKFFIAFRKSDNPQEGVSPYRALCTALAATVGTGNLVGVAGAIILGGPGSVFWMWICGVLGMATKFAEATLAVHYRVRLSNGEYAGGPMYMITNGLGTRMRPLAVVYCFFGVVAAFGVGNATQINAVIGGVNSFLSGFGISQTNLGNLIMGAGLATFIGIILFGGAKRIGAVAEMLIPFASVAYILLCVGVLIIKNEEIPHAISSILTGAFHPKAVTGGVLGSAFVAVRVGASRGVFTNEAGMGTASIAHGGANVLHPVQQGLMGIIEVFIDTIVICTLTALVILCSGVPIPYGEDVSVTFTVQAFTDVYGNWVSAVIAVSLCLFAIATVLGWGLYGIRCAQFLFGEGVWKPFIVMQTVAVLFGAILNTSTVWLLSETVNGLMAIPNLIALGLLCPELTKLVKNYREKKGKFAVGGTYEDINQCKPLRTVTNEKIPSSCCKSEEGREKDLSFEYRSAGLGHTG